MGSKARMMEASRVIDAPAQKIFAFLARAGNHVLLDTSGMTCGPAGHVTVTRTGTVFVMNTRNRIKGDHQVGNHVVVYEPLCPGASRCGRAAGVRSRCLRIFWRAVDLWPCRSSSLCCRVPSAAHEPADEEFHREVHAADNRQPGR
jgi:hypothetical protein